jgi:alkanesulfonate monooxygenase SsuD/methylene tetrahydromethanopterin reductase-like flavin-dependent oxidoreductase (luciferase family)
VLVVPFYHPLRLAEDIALADVFSNGRMVIGVGRGYQRFEFERLGVQLEDSRELFEEGVDLMVAALTQRSFTHHGKHWQVPETTIFPRPIQQPHPPIWVAANTPETVQFAVDRGFHVITTGGLMPRAQAAQVSRAVDAAALAASRPPGSVRFGLQRAVFVADSSAEARARVQDALWTHRITMRYMRGIADVRDGMVQADPLPDEPTPDEVYERVLFGTPDEVAEKLRLDVEATGATLVNCYFGPGRLPHEQTLRSIRLFAEEVIPRFARQPLGARG